MRAVVLGGARGVWQELEQAESMIGGRFDIVIGVNHAARDYPGRLDHWATFHTELLPFWIDQRRARSFPDAGAYWSVRNRSAPGLVIGNVEDWGGSSGLIGAEVGMLHADRVVLCGIPLDPEEPHFDQAGPWPDAAVHRRAWERHARDLDRKVRSMGGWTAELLGRPSREWLIHNGA